MSHGDTITLKDVELSNRPKNFHQYFFIVSPSSAHNEKKSPQAVSFGFMLNVSLVLSAQYHDGLK